MAVCSHQVKVKRCPDEAVHTENVVGELSHPLAHGDAGVLGVKEPPALVRTSVVLGVAV